MNNAFFKNTGDLMILFDLDGTLVDSQRDIAVSIKVGLNEVSGTECEEKDIFPLIGLPLTSMYETLLPEGFKHRAEEASEVYRNYFFDHCAVHSRLFPGVLECLEGLSGVRKAIATTKATFQAVRVVEEMDIVRHFDLVQGSDGLPHKPDPAVVNKVLDILGAAPEGSWMVGDTVYDIKAAKVAGLRTCAVTYGIGVPDELVKLNPDLVLDSLEEFPRLLTL